MKIDDVLIGVIVASVMMLTFRLGLSICPVVTP